MIALTRLNFETVLLNSDLIETIDTAPDTVIHLNTGRRLLVREGAAEILHKIRDFRRAVTPQTSLLAA